MTIRLRDEIARVQRRPEPDPERETAGGLTPGNRGAVVGPVPAPWTSAPFTPSAMARDGAPQAEEAVTVRTLEVTDAAPGRKVPGAGTPPADPGPTWPQVGSAARPTASHGGRGLLPEEAVATPGGPVPGSVPLSVPVSASVSLGPLDASVADPRVGDILVVAPDRVFAEIDGTLTRVPVAFGSDDAVLALAQRIAAPLGRELTVAHPFMDARLDALGLRITATIPPFSRRPTLSLRKTRSIAATQEDLLASGFATENALGLLAKAVRDRQNLIITGPTGAGKTTLARYLARHVPPYERMITVEETYELGLSELHPHVVELETRSGPYAIDADLALRQVLHMRPEGDIPQCNSRKPAPLLGFRLPLPPRDVHRLISVDRHLFNEFVHESTSLA